MNISIKATRYQLTEETRELVERKFSALKKFIPDTTTDSLTLICEIEQSPSVERAGAQYRVDGNLAINKKLFYASAQSGTLEGAIDRVRDELARELGDTRGKRRTLLKRGGAALKQLLRFGR